MDSSNVWGLCSQRGGGGEIKFHTLRTSGNLFAPSPPYIYTHWKVIPYPHKIGGTVGDKIVGYIVARWESPAQAAWYY